MLSGLAGMLIFASRIKAAAADSPACAKKIVRSER
jgi:hypothetical protein